MKITLLPFLPPAPPRYLNLTRSWDSILFPAIHQTLLIIYPTLILRRKLHLFNVHPRPVQFNLFIYIAFNNEFTPYITDSDVPSFDLKQNFGFVPPLNFFLIPSPSCLFSNFFPTFLTPFSHPPPYIIS